MSRNKFAKTASILMAMVLATSVLASCSEDGASSTASTTESNTTSTSGTESSSDSSTAVNPLRSDERRTLKVELFDRGISENGETCDNNYLTDYMRESFGEYANADIEFVLVPRSEEVDKLNVLMASKSAPDVCFTYNRDLVFQYATQGGLAALDEWYDQCPNLQAKLGDVVDYGKCNGELISIVGQRKHTANHVTVIRQDWLDACGLDAPTTREEWYNAMKTFKEQDPGNLGEKNYPFLIKSKPSEIHTILWSFVDPNMTEEQDFTLPYMMLPGWKDGMQFLNQMYNEGLINPEFALDQNDTMYKQAVSTGAWGSSRSLTANLITSDEAKTMYKNVPESDVTVIDPFENAEGKHLKNIYPDYSMFNIVPSFSEVPDLAMQYFEWQAQPEVATMMINGVEGVHWQYSEDGLRLSIPTEDRPDEWKTRRTWGGIDFYILDAHPENTYENEAKLRVYNAGATWLSIDKQPDPDRAAEVVKDYQAAMDNSLVDGFVDLREFPNYEEPMDSVSKYQVNLNKIYEDGYVKIITAPADQFEATYQQILDQYLQAGGQAIIDEKTAYYNEHMK
ncbi:MAG: extracellular solute-binding protein [Candidatus Merdivicinus sp.]|jgi:putative aldouronate transport system substrate-binding protein